MDQVNGVKHIDYSKLETEEDFARAESMKLSMEQNALSHTQYMALANAKLQELLSRKKLQAVEEIRGPLRCRWACGDV